MREAMDNLAVDGWERWRRMVLPAVFPAYVTGAITAAGGARNASIVAEILIYNRHVLVARGLGSFISQATARNSGKPTRLRCIAGLIGLRVIAETLTAPGSARQREPLDVLVAVTAPAQAEVLIWRGARLARRGNARCTVLTLGPPAGTPGDWTATVQTPAQDTGAAIIAREGRDIVAAIAQEVRETGARRLVIAAPPAGLLDRWRPSLAERLASQLPDIHRLRYHQRDAGGGRAAQHALQTDYSPATLGAKREQAFTIVAGHAERRQPPFGP
jgi:hypothetical protein